MDNNRDYRNTDQCPVLTEVALRKIELERRIRKEHSRTRIIYNRVNDKKDNYFQDFAEIYNFKCAYCGASLKFTDGRLFEVDHYICESAFPNNTSGRIEAGKIENLIFSCYSCNRGKGSLHIKGAHSSLLNPDDSSIANVFFRDEQYYIKLNYDYLEDQFICSFYEKLLLGSEFRRLDFLLLEIDNLINKLQINNRELACALQECVLILLQKKNCAFI